MIFAYSKISQALSRSVLDSDPLAYHPIEPHKKRSVHVDDVETTLEASVLVDFDHEPYEDFF
jgi:hypothetical protein